MTWWLKAAEELRTLRQLGIAKPGSIVSGFILDAPTVTIEGEATVVPPSAADQPADLPALSLPPPLEPAAQNRLRQHARADRVGQRKRVRAVGPGARTESPPPVARALKAR